MSTNRLDNEFEAFLKSQDSWQGNPDATGRLEVRCNVPLKDKIDPAKLQSRLDRTAEFAFEGAELDFLNTLPDITPEFSDYLKGQALPEARVLARGNDIMVRVDGKLADLPFWEVPISNQMHDLYFNGVIAENGLNGDTLVVEGVRRFQHKADLLRGSKVMFTEAGTRWRYAWDWYGLLFAVILGDIPNLLEGTTNPLTAFTHAVKVVNNRELHRLESPSVREIEQVLETELRPTLVAGTNAYEMAHLHSHFGDALSFEWGADLTSDMGPGGVPLPLSFETR